MAKQALEIRANGYSIGKPQQIVMMADVVKKYVVQQNLYTKIQDKNYVHVEGWQFGGGLMGLVPRVTRIENLSSGSETKWLAEVEIVRMTTGMVVSKGFAICSSKETKKKGFDEYAVLSMAQTRAIGKGYRNVIGYVMKLAGYEGTPAEEMTKTGQGATETAETVIQTEMVDYVCVGLTKGGCGEDLTKAEADYSIKRYGKLLCRAHQKEATPIKK